MQVLATILIGFVVGLVARFLMPGKDSAGIIVTSLLGIIGAMLGTFMGQAFGWYLPGEPAGFLMSVVGAMVVLAVVRAFAKRK